MAPWSCINVVQNALAPPSAAAQVVNAGPNVSNGVLLTEQIVWATSTSAPHAVVPTPSTLMTVTATATATATDASSIVVKRSGTSDFDSFGLVEDGAAGFDPNDPNVEIVESLHHPDGNKVDAAPMAVATKVAGAFGPNGAPAQDTDFSRHSGPVAPNSRHRQKNKSEMKKAQKKKDKNKQKSLQEERKAYLAGLAAKKAAAQAAAEAGAQ